MSLLYETDWLATRPVYYNESTGEVSTNINEVVDLENLEFDAAGLCTYLDHGCCAFARTPVRGVLALPPNSRLVQSPGERLVVESLPEDLQNRLEQRRSEDEVIDLLRAQVREVERSREIPIVIPTSGGYDSRLLNLMVEDRSRIRSFTFGVSDRQERSTEVIRARALAEALGTSWEHIELSRVHDFLDEWDDMFGPSMHAHGMYHLEFYHHIRERIPGPAVVLSGALGDWFAGKGDPLTGWVASPDDVRTFIRMWELHADSSMCYLTPDVDLYAEYFEDHREALSSRWPRLVEGVRFRLRLLHYLMRVPQQMGFRVCAPFTHIDVAAAMMTLPDERRDHRRWIADYFSQQGVALPQRGDSGYWIHYQAMRRVPLAPLDERLLRELFRPDYVRWINRNVGWLGVWGEVYRRLSYRRGLRRASRLLHRLGLRQRTMEAYWAYLTLRPIERLLRRRNAARNGGG